VREKDAIPAVLVLILLLVRDGKRFGNGMGTETKIMTMGGAQCVHHPFAHKIVQTVAGERCKFESVVLGSQSIAVEVVHQIVINKRIFTSSISIFEPIARHCTVCVTQLSYGGTV
jgi:hypothetical protein